MGELGTTFLWSRKSRLYRTAGSDQWESEEWNYASIVSAKVLFPNLSVVCPAVHGTACDTAPDNCPWHCTCCSKFEEECDSLWLFPRTFLEIFSILWFQLQRSRVSKTNHVSCDHFYQIHYSSLEFSTRKRN